MRVIRRPYRRYHDLSGPLYHSGGPPWCVFRAVSVSVLEKEKCELECLASWMRIPRKEHNWLIHRFDLWVFIWHCAFSSRTHLSGMPSSQKTDTVVELWEKLWGLITEFILSTGLMVTAWPGTQKWIYNEIKNKNDNIFYLCWPFMFYIGIDYNVSA